MLILGIETSCDETAASIVRDGRRVLSGVISSSVEEQALYGGIVPEIASRRHIETISDVVDKTLEQAGLQAQDVDAVAVTAAPGLIGALLVGVNFAKGLAYTVDKPLVPVHHIRGHIASLYLTHPDLEPPFLCLVASGGHSHIVSVKNHTSFEILGRTVDDAAGEAFDKVARTLGLGYPGGPAIADAAEKGDPLAFALPTPKAPGPYDFSFSGLKTAVLNIVNQTSMQGKELDKNSLAASFQLKAVEILASHLEQAAKDTGSKTICVAGGVAANQLLRLTLAEKAESLGAELKMPELKYCGDNAAMIASQGYYEFLAGNRAGYNLNAWATMAIDKDFPL